MKSQLFRVFANFTAWIWTILAFIPFVFILLFGVKNTTDIMIKPLAIVFKPAFDNFSRAWSGGVGSGGFSTWFANSIILVIVALAVSICAAVPAAYFTIFLPKKINEIVRIIIITGTTVPSILLVIPYFKTFNSLGLLNKPIATGIVYGVLAIPTTFLLMNRFFIDFPREVLEAGLVDGLSNVRIFSKLVLPLSVGQIVSVGFMTLIWAWGETQIAIVLLNKASAQPIAVGVLSFVGDFSVDYGAIFAGLSLAAFPPLIAYIALSKYVTKGIALGGITK
jgi:raffinose/stachyose/melibiose transport system permease protein